MKYDLNQGRDPQLTIEARFARENTNDLGEGLMPQTAHIIIAEFKKFMYLTALELMERKRNRVIVPTDRILQNDCGKKFIFQAPFCAPPYIDRMWRLLVLYNHDYDAFCKKLVGGFIDRDDPRENYELAFLRYQKTIAALEKRKDLLKPFMNLWPKYNNLQEFVTDYEFTSYISAEGLP